MNKKKYFLSILLMFALVLPWTVVHADDNGVDGLRGRWDVEWAFDGGEENPDSPLILYINDLVEIPNMPEMVFAGGCMRSPDTDTFMPLSLAAAPDPDHGTYEVSIYSTVVPDGEEPFVIRLAGEITVNGKGVPDDVASGEITTEFTTGSWSGTHHDRRRTKCPSLQNNHLFQGELYTHRDIAYNPYHETLIFDTETVIVSSAMLVEDPYGNVTRVEYYTDLFSPNVDFIGRFRFTGDSALPVIPGLPYTFTLLDAFGRPIEGAVSTDTWNRCDQGAPADFVATPGDDYINLSWLAVDPVEGEFDPGSYQITMHPMEGQAGEYGSDGIQANYHHMPLNHFEPPGEGVPDGQDFGDGLLNLENGPYEINVWAWNHADYTNGGWGSDCAVRDTSQIMIMHKQDDQFSFEVTGSISGNVSDAGGPLADVHVDACTLDDSFCFGAESNQDGNYRILGLPEGDYRVFVWGGQGGWIDEFYSETPFHHEATPVHVTTGSDSPDINFTMEPGGSISGNVSEAGNPLEGVHVDACAWDDSFCFGAETSPDGNYTVYGLPAGDYRAFVWGGQGGWVDEYYQETPFHHEAALISVSIGNDTPGIDFTMEPGSSISGTVFDPDGNPLGGIGVDIESGGFGACTDENGNYTLQGLPYGSYNIVAGRDFCGPHPFAEQTRIDVEAGSTDINFYLEELSGYQPVLHVVPAYPEIHGHDWNPEATVTIYVDDDDDLSNGYFYTESKLVNEEPTWCIAPCFDVSQVPDLPDGILPGYVVTMTDGEATRVVHTTELVWTGTDTEAETVFGTAAPGAWIEVRAHGPQEAMRMVLANEDGNWVADFSVPGLGEFEQDVLDLGPGYHGRAVEFEGGVPDDGTLAYWSIEEPPQPDYTIIAQPDHEWVSSFGWAVGDTITMYIDNNGDYLDGSLLSMTRTAVPADWDPNVGQVGFDSWEPFDLTPGMFVIVTDGFVMETLQVEGFSVDQWDETTATVSGTAPPEREVGVGLHQPGNDFWVVVMSDTNGQWSADFSAEGVDAPNVFDIHAIVWDQDGDATQANYNFP